MPVAGIRKPVNFFVIGDTHFGFHDSRDDAYADNYKRMAQCSSSKDALAKALTRAKKAHADAIMLVGVFTGHIHRLMVGQAGNALLFSVPSNRDGSCMEVRLSPS